MRVLYVPFDMNSSQGFENKHIIIISHGIIFRVNSFLDIIPNKTDYFVYCR